MRRIDRLRRLILVIALLAAPLSVAVAVTPAHADCLMVGQADFNSSGVATVHNHSVQMWCDGASRIRGYIQDTGCDSRHAVVEVYGYSSNGATIWHRRATADGCGNSTWFDFTEAHVARMTAWVWAENTWGLSDQVHRTYYA